MLKINSIQQLINLIKYHFNMIIYFICIYFLIIPFYGIAEIVFDDGDNKTLVTNSNTYNIPFERGTFENNNLRHTFHTFNIEAEKTASFQASHNNQIKVNNIVCHVTKGRSFINGKIELAQAIHDANFFLLNPAGIIFGKQASLDIGGTFCITTANNVILHNNSFEFVFNEENILNIESPENFGFDISLSNFNDTDTTYVLPLNVQDFVIVGGDISIDKSYIIVPGRDIYIFATGSKDTVEFSFDMPVNTSIIKSSGTICINESMLNTVSHNSINSGNVYIQANNISVKKSSISTYAYCPGSTPGNISIITLDTVVFADSSSLASPTFLSNSAGNILIDSGKFVIFTNHSGISAHSSAEGKGGDITIKAGNTIFLSDSNLHNTAIDQLTDQAGDIFFLSSNIFFQESSLNANTEGFGNAGNIYIGKDFKKKSDGSIVLNESANQLFLSNGSTISTMTSSKGKGGNINLNIDNIYLNSGFIESTSSFDDVEAGDAGSISIFSKSLIQLTNSEITTDSKQSSGGNINTISTNLILTNSKITSSVFSGIKHGGDISIKTHLSVLLNNSMIKANAYEGRGGNIHMISDHYISSTDSIVDATSFRGIDGTVFIDSPDKETGSRITLLNKNYLSADQWIKTPCSQRNGKNVSHFAIYGRDGLPSPLDDFFNSPPMDIYNLSQEGFIQNNRFKNPFKKGKMFYENGQFAKSIQYFRNALTLKSNDKGQLKTQALLYLVDALKKCGHYEKALNICDKELKSINKRNDKIHKALFYSYFADLYLINRENDSTLEFFNNSEEYAKQVDEPYIIAYILNNKANYYGVNGKYYDALKTYQKAMEYIKCISNKNYMNEFLLTVLINIARLNSLEYLSYKSININYVIYSIQSALIKAHTLQDSYFKASKLLSIGQLALEVKSNKQILNEYIPYLIYASLDAFDKTIEIAKKNKYIRIASYAFGYKGELYEKNYQYQYAIKLTNEAIFYSQEANIPESLYLWQWQLGRLLKSTNNKSESIKSYTNAITTLTPSYRNSNNPCPSGIIQEINKGYRQKRDLFSQKIKPVYLEVSDLLLTNSNNEKPYTKINQAIDVLEQLKKREIQNFYKDECVTSLKETKESIFDIKKAPPHAAIIYPIVFNKKLSFIIIFSDSKKHISISVNECKLKKQISGFSKEVINKEHINTKESYASELYQILISPIENELLNNKIENLIIIPDGMLRLVLFSALFDEQTDKYLIEKYAISTLPGIYLTNNLTDNYQSSKIMLNGLSESRHGFCPLPNVEKELKAINNLFAGDTLLNANFTYQNLQNQFEICDYYIVHMSTHGVFGGSVDKSYLVAYDCKLSMEDIDDLFQIVRYKNKPVDLLVLSACETAIGDEKASLGLAGIALKSGVNSVIASLWYVEDESTSLLMEEFYRQYRNNSKMKALQLAQQKFISSEKNSNFSHPKYWAPFILIGNCL